MHVYHTLTSLIGKNRHSEFRKAAAELKMLTPDFQPAKGKWRDHLEPFTRNTVKGPVSGFKYTKEFVTEVLEKSPGLKNRLDNTDTTSWTDHLSLSRYIGSSGHAPFKAVMIRLGYLTEEGGIKDPTFKHIKKKGYYLTYSPQIIIKVVNEEPSLLSQYADLHRQYNSIREALGLQPIELPPLEVSEESDDELPDLGLV